MAGIFGIFSEEPIKENIDTIHTIFEKHGYVIKKILDKKKYLICSLDIRSESTQKEPPSENQHNIITSGLIYNQEINDLDQEIYTYFKNDRLHDIKNLNGIFVSAIYDDKKNELTIMNDRHGSIKIYYTYFNGLFIFSPKIKPLLELGAKKTINKKAIMDFLIFGYPLEHRTLLENIHVLLPGSILHYTKGSIDIERYYTYTYDGSFDKRSIDDSIESLYQLWNQAVKRRLQKDQQPLILLSGGLDSRAILSSALENHPIEYIHTATFGDKKSMDYKISKKITEDFNIKNHPLPQESNNFENQYLLALENSEGMIDATPYYPIHEYQKLVKTNPLIFSGYMGGELMGPLILSKISKKYEQLQHDINLRKSIILDHFKLHDPSFVKKLLNEQYFNEETILDSFNESIHDIDKIDFPYFPTFCAAWLYRNENYKYTSFCNFRFQNTCRYITPFLDNDLTDYMNQLPSEYKKDKKLYSLMLRKKYHDLFYYPTKNTYGCPLQTNTLIILLKRIYLGSITRINKISTRMIKRNILLDPLENYIDYNNLLRTNKSYENFIKKKLDELKKRDYFKKEEIDELWNDHIKGKKNYAKIFGILVTIELFIENFIENKNE